MIHQNILDAIGMRSYEKWQSLQGREKSQEERRIYGRLSKLRDILIKNGAEYEPYQPAKTEEEKLARAEAEREKLSKLSLSLNTVSSLSSDTVSMFYQGVVLAAVHGGFLNAVALFESAVKVDFFRYLCIENTTQKQLSKDQLTAYKDYCEILTAIYEHLYMELEED